MKMSALSQKERERITAIVVEALVKVQGRQVDLFRAPLNFTERDGCIKFNFPSWMDDIKCFLSESYSASQTQSILLDLMMELMKPNGVSQLVALKPIPLASNS